VTYEYLGCTHTAHSKRYEAAMCNDQDQTMICSHPKECKVRPAD
jgi:hypothetical protein